MDPFIQGSMIFTIIMTVIVGGFIVTFPIMRRLGRVMEESIRDRQDARLGRGEKAALEADIGEIRSSMERLEGHVGLLAERQDFVDNLLSHREPGKLPEPEGEDWRQG